MMHIFTVFDRCELSQTYSHTYKKEEIFMKNKLVNKIQ